LKIEPVFFKYNVFWFLLNLFHKSKSLSLPCIDQCTSTSCHTDF